MLAKYVFALDEHGKPIKGTMFYYQEGDTLPEFPPEYTHEGTEEIWLNQHRAKWDGTRFILNPIDSAKELASAQEAKIAELKTACNKDILSGFGSYALGTLHTYGFSDQDQRNFIGAIGLYNANPSLGEIDWTTNEGRITHTREQFLQVYTDGFIGHLNTKVTKYNKLKSDVQAYLKKEAVEKIVW